ncbi:MAG TPA: VOC family protein [Candidatus Dormibacteraeota bacterium]|nr:VOC family protein [Candidatus Dormibacteraeota bacterium]
MIRAIGHVALQVPNLNQSVGYAVQVMGLREVERRDGNAYLTHGSMHHSLQYVQGPRAALDHISLEADGVAGLERVRDALARSGVRVLSETPQEPGLARALRFLGPSGVVIEVYADMEGGQPSYVPSGVRPRKFGHITLKSSNLRELQGFLTSVLGFKLSDDIGPGMLVFLRCNPDHHGLAIAAGTDGHHHYAWEVESIADLARLGDLLDTLGRCFLWGPGRHGAGDNIFTYHHDPAGAIVEYYADMERIYDDRPPRIWDINDRRAANLWGASFTPEFIEDGLPNADPGESGRE